MYLKNKTLKLVEKISPKFIQALGLKSWTIDFHVYKSGAKALLNMGLDKNMCIGKCGLSYISVNNKHADVILFYDNLEGKKGAYSTILHELLHVSLGPLTSNITIKYDKAYRDEEKIVSLLEQMFMEKFNG